MSSLSSVELQMIGLRFSGLILAFPVALETEDNVTFEVTDPEKIKKITVMISNHKGQRAERSIHSFDAKKFIMQAFDLKTPTIFFIKGEITILT